MKNPLITVLNFFAGKIEGLNSYLKNRIEEKELQQFRNGYSYAFGLVLDHGVEEAEKILESYTYKNESSAFDNGAFECIRDEWRIKQNERQEK